MYGFWEMRAITIKEIIHTTAKYFNMPAEVLVSKNVSRDVVLRRHIAMYIAQKLTYKSLRVIATAFDMSYSGSVAHAVNKVTVLTANTPQIETDIQAIIKSLNQEENENASSKLPITSGP